VLTHLPTTLSAKLGYVHSASQYPVLKSPKVPAEQDWVQFPVALSIKYPYVQIKRQDFVTLDL
jgi:hypothetical protein